MTHAARPFYRLLGPVSVELPGDDGVENEAGDGEEHSDGVTGRQRMAVLAQLVMHAPHPVTIDRLVREIYRDDDPESEVGGPGAIRQHVRRLRGVLGEELPRMAGGGYALRDPGDRVDVRRFERAREAADRARRSGDLAELADCLRTALRCWTGTTAMENIQQFSFARQFAALWNESRQHVVRELYDTLRRLDRHHEIDRLVREEPWLADVAAHRPAADRESLLIGLEEAIGTLGELLRRAAGGEGRFIIRISGPAGIGITSVVKSLTSNFVGVLGIDMRTGAVPNPMVTAQRELLGLLGLSRGELPPPEDRAAACADLLAEKAAERRLILVFDHVTEADQVLPLLPAATLPVTVLICSRPTLSELPADAVVELEPLTTASAVDLLRSVSDAKAVDNDLGAARDIVELCDRIPQWIVVVGQDLLDWGRSAADEVAELRRVGGAGGPDAGHILDFTLRPFPPEVIEAFAMIGRLNAEDVTPARLAAMQETGVPVAAATLAKLARARLMTADDTGSRYRMPGIMRHQAGRLPLGREWPPALNRAVGQILAEAESVAASFSRPAAGREGRFAWYEANSANLTSAAGQVLTEGDPGYCWRLLRAVQPILGELVDTANWRYLLDIAEAATRDVTDPVARAYVLIARGQLHRYTPDYQRAWDELDAAVELLRDAGDPIALAQALDGRADFAVGLAQTADQKDRYKQADRDLEEARQLCVAAGYGAGVGSALRSLGEVRYFRQGPAAATPLLEQALRIASAARDPLHEAITLRMLGRVHLAAEGFERAEDCLRRAIEINKDIGNRLEEARSRMILGQAYAARARRGDALEQFQAALDVLRPRHDVRWLARLRQAMGTLLAEGGDPRAAREHLLAARGLYLQISEGDAVDECDRALARLDGAGP